MMLQMFQQQEELSASVNALVDMLNFVQDTDKWKIDFIASAAQRITFFFF